MIFDLPVVQESMENRKEIAPANHIPKKSKNLGTWSEKYENGVTKWGCKGPGNSLFSDLGAYQLHFCPQVVFVCHFDGQLRQNGPQMKLKGIPKYIEWVPK